MNSRQAHETSESGIIIIRQPQKRKVHALILVSDGPEYDPRIGDSAPMFGDEADSKSQSDEIHNTFATDPMSGDMGRFPKIS